MKLTPDQTLGLIAFTAIFVLYLLLRVIQYVVP